MDDLLDDIDREQDAAPKSSQQLECQEQNESRALSKDLLAKISGAVQPLKRSTETSSNGEGPSTAKKVHIDEDKKNEEEEREDAEEENDFDQMMKKNKKIITYRIPTTDKNCNHEVCMPFDQEFSPLKLNCGEMAKTFPFELDPFQKAAIRCLDNEQSVLVSAHTSAGKTVVAIYAISLALRSKQRVIYTSPIKALSNQKFRELSDEFEDVGLMTGDVTVNPNASCIVMTTEILRSMLYRGTEIMREVGWVIFDEIHYMRDKERGVVWEETIILLPDTTHYVFLSATIPNATQFAEWICYLHHQPCNVVYTNMRPVPLQHLIFPAGGSGLYEVVDTKGKFRADKFQEAMGFLEDSQPIGENVQQQRRSQGGGDAMNKSVIKIIQTIKERDMLPCIIFSFSRKECEMYATNVKKMDFNTDEEKESIRLIFSNAVDLLSDEDKKLPQIQNVLPYLLRGIGIHHSGQLPIMKEIVEILFGEGLIKTLFATETFAMGVNMPAKTVLFTSARKFDGTTNRPINSGEYIQMSGRAGRRGKDEKGLVILMMDQQMSAEQAQQLMKGNSDPLNSQFRLTYNMVLNLLRVPEINPEFMMEKSFYQWQNYSSLPSLFQAMRDKKANLNLAKIEQELEIEGFYNIEKRIQQLKKSIKEKVIRPAKVMPFFQPGRLLKLKHFERDFDWGVLVNWRKMPNPLDHISTEMLYIVEVGVPISVESEQNLANLSMVKPPEKGQGGIICVLPFTFDCITGISTIRLKLAKDLKTREAREALGITLAETKKRFEGIIPELDPIEHMKVVEPSLKNELASLQQHEQRCNEHPIRSRPDFDNIYKAYQEKLRLAEEYKVAKKKFEDGRKLLQIEELQCRKRVLRRLGFATEEDTITEKGRVACELSSADELLLTEMIFTGTFSGLKPEEAAALLTCFVFEERAPNTRVNDAMAPHFRSLQNQAKRIAAICSESKLELNEEKYVEQFGPGMIDVVYKWCKGHTFAQIMEDTTLFEGSIIRCMRRLDELLQEMVNAAKSMGDKAMEAMFDMARALLKRDIVFSASLYH